MAVYLRIWRRGIRWLHLAVLGDTKRQRGSLVEFGNYLRTSGGGGLRSAWSTFDTIKRNSFCIETDPTLAFLLLLLRPSGPLVLRSNFLYLGVAVLKHHHVNDSVE
jgi:hypothetical protein